MSERSGSELSPFPGSTGNAGPFEMSGTWQYADLFGESAARLNRELLARFPGRVFPGDALPRFVMHEHLRDHLVPGLLHPESRATVYPVPEDASGRILALARRWPDPQAPGIDSYDALRAIAPTAILDHLRIQPAGDAIVTAASGAGAVQLPQAGGPAGFLGPAPGAAPLPAPENIMQSLGDVARLAVEAFTGSDWHVTARPWGTVSVDLNPETCRTVSLLAGMVAAYGGNNFVKSLLSGKPWYMILIWGLLTADTGYVGMVLSSCAEKNRPARLYWNAFTGIFYAAEITDAGARNSVT